MFHVKEVLGDISRNPQLVHLRDQEENPETTPVRNPEAPRVSHQDFRYLQSLSVTGPHQAVKQIQELCWRWLQPEMHTKEQMMDRLVLEQFMVCMPLECQVLLKESGVQSCKDLEDVLRNKQKPKKWVSRTSVMGVG